jgi:2-C-methyl-D-erythritol 4-phosphate cytidylyltransferase/2-C-methyl-D-erythritol 2,4-cyclodiphosphate synthase
MIETVALVVAAGRGKRLGGDIPKQYRRLAGQSMLARSLKAFIRHPRITDVRAIIHPDDHALYNEATADLDLMPVVFGGATRHESSKKGLESLASNPPVHVLIHDASRPLVDAATIDRVLAALDKSKAAIAALPVRDTIKRDDGNATVFETIDRAALWRAQTPQGFEYSSILAAHQRPSSHTYTDDAAVSEASGMKVKLVLGDEENFKITTGRDFRHVERLLTGSEMRVGNGFDVHRFGPGNQITLCGIAIPHDQGLIGHSDADAGLHALTDAILGALGAGDIGEHFPPTDPQWKGKDSSVFLQHAVTLLNERDGSIRHLDVTLICEHPKISPHRQAMQRRVAEIIGIDSTQVSVKATTTEGLGFAGRSEGVAAQAVATIALF